MISLTQPELNRLEKLSRESGRTPRAVLKYVLRDGFDECERVLVGVKKGREDAKAGRTLPHEAVMQQAREITHARKKKAA